MIRERGGNENINEGITAGKAAEAIETIRQERKRKEVKNEE